MPTTEVKKVNRRKVATKRRLNVKTADADDNESNGSAEDEQLVPVGPGSVSAQNRLKPVPELHENRFKLVPQSDDKFAFSSLMRQMAKKYQDHADEEEK